MTTVSRPLSPINGDREFNRSEFKNNECIGRGGQGQVYLVEHDLKGKMAMKLFNLNALRCEMDRETLREIEYIMEFSNHPNIIRFFGYVVDNFEGERIITGYVMEYMSDGSLSRVIHDSTIAYDSMDIIRWGGQAALALAWLHSEGIIHRDVKPLNMLLSDSLKTLKLCDFGCMRMGQEHSMSMGVGTLSYMPPELRIIIERGRYSEKYDVYSMGVTIWEMITRTKPCGTEESNRPTHEVILLVPLRDIIKLCFSENPSDRPTMKELADYLMTPSELHPEYDSNDDIKTLTPGNGGQSQLEVHSEIQPAMPTEPLTKQVNKKQSPWKILNRFTEFLAKESYDGAIKTEEVADENLQLQLKKKRVKQKKSAHLRHNKTPSTIFQRLMDKTIKSRNIEGLPNTSRVHWIENEHFLTIAVNPSRDLIASVSNHPYQTRIWDLSETDGETIKTEEIIKRSQKLYVTSNIEEKAKQFTWSSSGDRLITVLREGSLKIWTYHGKLESKIHISGRRINDAKWNSNDQYILMKCSDSIIIWDYRKGHQVQEFCFLRFSTSFISKIAWINMDTFVASVHGKRLHIFQIGSEKPIKKYGDYALDSRKFFLTVDGMTERIATFGGHDNRVRIYSLELDEPVHYWEINCVTMLNIEWSPNGHILACCFTSRSILDTDTTESCIELWNMMPGSKCTLLRKIPIRAYSNFAFSPDCKFIATDGDKRFQRLAIWNIHTGECFNGCTVGKNKYSLQLCNIRWNYSGKKLIVHFWDAMMLIIEFDEEMPQLKYKTAPGRDTTRM